MPTFAKLLGPAAVSLLLFTGTASLAAAQTSTGAAPTTTTAPTTPAVSPGIPNTGSGGDAALNLALLGTSALVAVAGAAYLARRLTE